MTTLLHAITTTAQAMTNAVGVVIGYRPFLDPLPVDDIWLVLLLPLVFAIAVVYKTIKLDNLSHLLSSSTYLAVQIIVFMGLAAGVIWLISALA